MVIGEVCVADPMGLRPGWFQTLGWLFGLALGGSGEVRGETDEGDETRQDETKATRCVGRRTADRKGLWIPRFQQGGNVRTARAGKGRQGTTDHGRAAHHAKCWAATRVPSTSKRSWRRLSEVLAPVL